MPFYHYKAQDESGRVLQTIVEYKNEETLSANLAKMGLSVQTVRIIPDKISRFIEVIERFKSITNYDLIIFTRQLSTIVNSGVNLIEGLRGISKQTRNRKLKAVINDITGQIETGSTLSNALETYPSVFNEMFVNMIRVGETGGILDSVLERISEMAIHETEITSKIKAAMAYPLIVITMCLLVVTSLLVFVMPKFIALFEAAGADLPLPTKILLGASTVLSRGWPIFLILFSAAGWLFHSWLKSEKGRYCFDRIRLSIPLFGPLYSKILISRFTRLLAELSKSGVPLLSAMEVVGRTIDNKVLSQIINGAQKAVAQGQNLSDPLHLSGIFPPMVIQMITVGEKTGKLEEMLTEISGFYNLEVEYSLRNLTSWIEPVMIIIMGTIVGFIALSVLLPIFNLIKLFK